MDTHCHLHDREFFSAEQAEEMLKRAHEKGVEKVICIGTSHEDSMAARDFTARHENVYWTYGIHPEFAGEEGVADISWRRGVRSLARREVAPAARGDGPAGRAPERDTDVRTPSFMAGGSACAPAYGIEDEIVGPEKGCSDRTRLLLASATSNFASGNGAFTSGSFASKGKSSGLGSAMICVIISSAKVSGFTPEESKSFKSVVIFTTLPLVYSSNNSAIFSSSGNPIADTTKSLLISLSDKVEIWSSNDKLSLKDPPPRRTIICKASSAILIPSAPATLCKCANIVFASANLNV